MGDSQCAFVVPKKGRRCRLRPVSGSHYCGQHIVLSTSDDGHDRIVCPLDSTHTCSAALLCQHLKKCNAKKKENHDFFVRNINSGTLSLPGEHPCVTKKVTLKDVGDEKLLTIIQKIDKIFDEQVPVPEEQVQQLHGAFAAELQALSGCAVAEKHLRQKAALLGLAQHHGLLARDSCFVEFGAGRAQQDQLEFQRSRRLARLPPLPTIMDHTDSSHASQAGDRPAPSSPILSQPYREPRPFAGEEGRLSYWLAKILVQEDCRFLLIDRAASRHKFENKLKKEQENVPEIQRLQVDIQHLCLGKVDLVREHRGKLVGLCKHLCGEATDFALRCLVGTGQASSDTSCRIQPFRGVLMATCCHHRCRWDSFVGQPFLKALGLDRTDFELLTCLAGWATCAAREAQVNSSSGDHCAPEEPSAAINRYVRMGLSVGRREEVGRRCKLLLDEARVRYLGSATMLGARLVHFISRDVTPENVAILAT